MNKQSNTIIDNLEVINIRSFVDVQKCDDFDCGIGFINNFFQKEAYESDLKNFARTTLLFDGHNKRILGFYTLTASVVSFHENYDGYRKFEKPSGHETVTEIPALDLSFFAVDKYYQEQGFGRVMMEYLYKQLVFEVGLYLGFAFLLVESLNHCTEFYEKVGFMHLIGEPNCYLEKHKMVIAFPNIVDYVIESTRKRIESK